jgi:hypothetical protein
MAKIEVYFDFLVKLALMAAASFFFFVKKRKRYSEQQEIASYK